MTLVQLRTGGAQPESGLMDRDARRVRYLRVSLTDRCNYRCTYCMPDERLEYGPRSGLLSLEEIETICRVFVGWGVERIRLTGGEPTLRRDMVQLVARLKQVLRPNGQPITVTLTTNGERTEPLLSALHQSGLDSITVSLDTLRDDRFREITRRGDLARVLGTLHAAASLPTWAVKLNTVAIRGFNDEELPEIAQFAWRHGMMPRFIEQMPMAGGGQFVPGQFMAASEVRSVMGAAFNADIEPESPSADVAGPARYFRVARGKFAGQRFGTIAAMSENFCASCNRLRLSATGQLHGCLARDDAGDLRWALRHGGEVAVASVVASVLGTKRPAHGFDLDGSGGPAKAMVSIGG